MQKRLSYANVVSTLALVFAIGTGGAWAATQINGKLLKKNTVTGNKLKKNTLGTREVNEAKLGAVPRAVSADSLQGQGPDAFLPAGGTAANAANANQLGGLAPSAFVQGGGTQQTGRTSVPAGDNPNVVKSFSTPVGEFRLACGNANADARYVNTTPGDAQVFRTIVGPATTDTFFNTETSGNAMGVGFSVTAANGPHFLEIRAGKGEQNAILRAAERREPSGTCIFNWELVSP